MNSLELSQRGLGPLPKGAIRAAPQVAQVDQPLLQRLRIADAGGDPGEGLHRGVVQLPRRLEAVGPWKRFSAEAVIGP